MKVKAKTLVLLTLFFFVNGGGGLRFLSFMQGDVSIALVLMLICACFFFKIANGRNYAYFASLRMKYVPLFLIVSGIILSMIPAWICHGQSPFTSVLAYRTHVLWIMLPFLFFLKPGFRIVIDSMFYYVCFMLFLWALKFAFPSLFVMNENEMAKASEGDIGVISGFAMAAMPLYYYTCKLKKRYSVKVLARFLVCLLFVMVLQNRSLLFTSVVLMLFAFLKGGGKRQILISVAALLFLSVVFVATFSFWLKLFEETVLDVGNSDYNRNLAMLYFLTEGNPSLLTTLFGNGFLSAHSTDLMKDLMAQGIYNADVGFIGYWNQYGLLPIAGFLYVLIFTIRRRLPLFLKMNAVQIIVCSLTICYYGEMSHAMSFMLLYYLSMYFMASAKTPLKIKRAVPDAR